MTRKHIRTATSIVALATAALAAAPAHAGDDDPRPADISIYRPYIFEGTLWLPDVAIIRPRGTSERACHGRVRLSVRSNGRMIGFRRISLPPRCYFPLTMGVGSAQRVQVTVTFPGNERMGRATKTFTVKLGRPRFDRNAGG